MALLYFWSILRSVTLLSELRLPRLTSKIELIFLSTETEKLWNSDWSRQRVSFLYFMIFFRGQNYSLQLIDRAANILAPDWLSTPFLYFCFFSYHFLPNNSKSLRSLTFKQPISKVLCANNTCMKIRSHRFKENCSVLQVQQDILFLLKAKIVYRLYL